MADLEIITCHRVFRELFWVSSVLIFLLIFESWGASLPALLVVDILMHDPRTVGLRWDVWVVSGKLKFNQKRFGLYLFLDSICRLQGLGCKLVLGRLWSLWRNRGYCTLLWYYIVILLWSIFSAKWFWLKNLGRASLKNFWTFDRFVCYRNAGSSRRILAWPRLPILASVRNNVSAMNYSCVSGKLLNFSHQSSIFDDKVVVTLRIWLAEFLSKSPVLFQVIIKSWSRSIIRSDVTICFRREAVKCTGLFRPKSFF